MATVRTREAARVIALNENDQVLLLRYDEGAGVFWATPGGALEPGETHAQAARREPVRQVERYFIARPTTPEVDLTQAPSCWARTCRTACQRRIRHSICIGLSMPWAIYHHVPRSGLAFARVHVRLPVCR